MRSPPAWWKNVIEPSEPTGTMTMLARISWAATLRFDEVPGAVEPPVGKAWT